MAKSVVNSCQLCKKRFPQLLQQSMGMLPKERLQPAPPFTNVMLDLFGPYSVRGEVQKRTTGKAYGVVFTDLTSRAVHIEVCFGYDTSSFLLALKRFTSLRGWPSTIFSDPGSQLTAAEKELKAIWSTIEKERLYKSSTDKGLQWRFGPADSPWNQGAVEALVKSIKRCLKVSMENKRLSPSEFATVCYEVANTLNERPLGVMTSEDSEINLLTPNSLILGRAIATSITDSHYGSDSWKERYNMVSFISQKFWEQWIQLYAPTLVAQSKWQKTTRNLQVGDIVQVCDSNALRSQYHIARVVEVYPDDNGIVRRVKVRYKSFKSGEKANECTGSHGVSIMRSVHRLALLEPIEGMPADK